MPAVTAWLLTTEQAYFSHAVHAVHAVPGAQGLGSRAVCRPWSRRARPVGIGLSADIRHRKNSWQSSALREMPEMSIGTIHRSQGHQSQPAALDVSRTELP